MTEMIDEARSRALYEAGNATPETQLDDRTRLERIQDTLTLENIDLKAQNAALLAALEDFMAVTHSHLEAFDARRKARAAIAQAKPGPCMSKEHGHTASNPRSTCTKGS